MPEAAIYLVSSTVFLVLLMLLFRIEEARGKRFAARFRAWLDDGCFWLATKIAKIRLFIGAGTVRLFIHFVMHHVLKAVLFIVRSSERLIESRLRRNRQRATALSDNLEHRSYLVEIAEHKRATALTEREKRQLRSHY